MTITTQQIQEEEHYLNILRGLDSIGHHSPIDSMRLSLTYSKGLGMTLKVGVLCPNNEIVIYRYNTTILRYQEDRRGLLPKNKGVSF